jgi:hypothetical protein
MIMKSNQQRGRRGRVSGNAALVRRMPMAAVLLLSLALPAHASQFTRTFVSSGGNDSNSCTITQPCASFARAYIQTLPNGIIAALDPGKYGSLTIAQPITINGNGWSAVTALAQGNGFTINAGSGDVTLIGIEIDGAGAAYNGIVFNSGSSLTVTGCTVQNFVQDGGQDVDTGNGILVQPTTGTLSLAVTNTTVANNQFTGIYYLPAGGSPVLQAVVDGVTALANNGGIVFSTNSGTTTGTISNSVVSNNNSGVGIGASILSTDTLSIDSVTVTNNPVGISVLGGQVTLGRSVVTGNQTGIYNVTQSLYSYGNNQINLNSTQDINGSLASFTNK